LNETLNNQNREKRRIKRDKVIGKFASYSDVSCFFQIYKTFLEFKIFLLNLKKIVEWMKELGQLYPNLIQVKTIGKTFEKRPIVVLKMSDNIGNNFNNKQLFLFESGIHAREW
jgi:hypothetical protein